MNVSQLNPKANSSPPAPRAPPDFKEPQTAIVPFACKAARATAQPPSLAALDADAFKMTPGDPAASSLYALTFDRHDNCTAFHHIQQLKNTSWPRYYGSNHLANYDPVVSELVRSAEPFLWEELEHRRGRLTAPEKLTLAEAARFGLKHGLCMPIRRNEHEAVGVIVGFSEAAHLPDGAKDAAQNLARRYGDYVLSRPARPKRRVSPPSRLRPRQVECLRWVAAGKTSYEIAIMLSLSKKTVDEHIDNACKTFGVNGRIQAVVRALRLGLLDLNS